MKFEVQVGSNALQRLVDQLEKAQKGTGKRRGRRGAEPENEGEASFHEGTRNSRNPRFATNTEKSE